MVQVSERKALSGPALIRLLARLTDARFAQSGQPLADQLGQWLLWTDAIALSAALGGTPSAAAPGGVAPAHSPDGLCTRVRTSLTNAIAGDAMLAPQRNRTHARHRHLRTAADTAPEYAAFRQCYLSLQEQMSTAIGNLRTLLRAMLASGESAMARLASVDAVMERVLGVREHNALAAVPALLAVRFERLRDAQLAAHANAETAAPDAKQTAPARAHGVSDCPTVKDGPWLDIFRKDMQSVLFAELEIRFQPVEGLRAALHAC